MEISLEQRVANLERMFKALMSKTSNDKNSVDTDTQGLRDINFSQSTDIADNRTGIEETFESSLTNADDIADVRTALEEVYEIITESEV